MCGHMRITAYLLLVAAASAQVQTYQPLQSNNQQAFQPLKNDTVWLTAQGTFITGTAAEGDIHGHAHDPQQDVNLQGLDTGINFNYGHFAGFANVNTFESAEGTLGSEMEEAFIKVQDLPLNLTLRGGRFLNRIGTQNSTHLHGWTFTDANASTIHYLGEEGLTSNGGEITWDQEYEKGIFAISTAYGAVVEHEHGHEEEEEEEHEGWADEVLTTRALLKYNVSDFYQNALGANYAKAVGGGTRDLLAVDYTFTWRANGLEAGGNAFSVTGEYYQLDAGEEPLAGTLFGAQYTWDNGFSVAARYEDAEFEHEHEGEHELTSREKYSLAVSYMRPIDQDWFGIARLQYNTDSFEGDNSNSTWLQLGLNYGGGEVR